PDTTLHEWARQDGVEWLGQLADVRALWRQCPIAALASQGGGGVPLSLVAAAACGRPPGATGLARSPRLARAGVNALLAPPHAPLLLADALERLIKDETMRTAFAAEGRRIAESTFSADHVLAATLALYDDLLNRPPAPASAK